VRSIEVRLANRHREVPVRQDTRRPAVSIQNDEGAAPGIRRLASARLVSSVHVRGGFVMISRTCMGCPAPTPSENDRFLRFGPGAISDPAQA
jgi:hypothetical protein